ncbi:uncharacterized protein IUM83_12770 [Phytophthora cinnamomi]|uniref:uncharacterized protein n=1 Tax=Phytophthora cinnamomi TaxID=4785 RepID=UPI00355A621C|nr:hypothetical protein IUM83_12770 [Phytophthora cinnamomi]
MLVRDKVEEGIEAIKGAGNIDLVAHWPDYGCATFDQLDAMASIHEARNNFKLVMRTLKWLASVEWRVSDLREPFQDTSTITKSELKGYVETLNLAVNKIPGETVAGSQLMDFREDLWLHTASLLVALFVLRDEYPDVGIIHPSFNQFAVPEQKRRVAGGCGASDPKYKRVVGVLNINLHWVSFLIDRDNEVCYMFDPLQSDSNYKIIEKSGAKASKRSTTGALLDNGTVLSSADSSHTLGEPYAELATCPRPALAQRHDVRCLPAAWKPHLEKNNCAIYRQKEAADASNLQRKSILCAKIDTPLEDAPFLDSAVLQMHEKASADDPFRFIGNKWHVWLGGTRANTGCVPKKLMFIVADTCHKPHHDFLHYGFENEEKV